MVAVEQAGDLVAAQHHGQLARMGQPDQLAREIRPIERVREEEPQRRHDAVNRRHRNAGLELLDLEAPQVVRRGRAGRATQEGGEPPDVADVVALRLSREPAQGHVVDQSLAQRADWRSGLEIVHRMAPWIKEPRCPVCLRRRSSGDR